MPLDERRQLSGDTELHRAQNSMSTRTYLRKRGRGQWDKDKDGAKEAPGVTHGASQERSHYLLWCSV